MTTLIEVHVEGTVPVHGYLALDSFVAGAAHGGLRIASDVTPERLREAARTMTLKYGWAGLPVGGAKSGLLMPAGTTELDRALMLRGFGQALRPYLRSGSYVPGEDMGSTADDIRAVLRAAGMSPRSPARVRAASGVYTGVGVCAAALAAATALDLPAKGLRVTIEGFGNVGASTARRLHEAGAKVVGVSTTAGGLYRENGLDVRELLSLRRRYGDDAVLHASAGDAVPPRELASLPADVFCPCAEMHSITADNARTIQARVVCPGANVPATAEAEELLYERDVLFLPDFVANCGGVLGGSMARAGIGRDEIAGVISRWLHRQTSLLIVDAREQRRTLREVATEKALESFDEAKTRYEMHTPVRTLTRFAVGIYRRGLIPTPLLAPFGRRYYRAWEERYGE